MSSLRNDGRIWVPAKLEGCKAIREGKLKPTQIVEADDYYLERRYPAFGNLVPRDVALASKERCDAGFGVNKTGETVYLDFAAAIQRYGKNRHI
jgi:succinate dehydrogenase / fumarate reductase flavoprotein subunit